MIREARLRAGLSQGELSERSGKDRAQIARWERDVVQPSFETLRDLVRACGFDLEFALVPYEADEREVAACGRRSCVAAGAPPGDAEGAAALMADVFDPIAILRPRPAPGRLHRHRRARPRDPGKRRGHRRHRLVPSTREENFRKLGLALEDLNARRVDGKPLALEEGLSEDPCSARDGRRRAEGRPRAGRDARLRRPPPGREP